MEIMLFRTTLLISMGLLTEEKNMAALTAFPVHTTSVILMDVIEQCIMSPTKSDSARKLKPMNLELRFV